MPKKIKIFNIFPDIYTNALKGTAEERKRLATFVKKETGGLVELETVFVDKGLASIESAYDESINTPYILEKVKWGEKQGCDAVTIDCMGDPGLDAAKELANVPVIGACESSVHLASMLGKRFSVINILPETGWLIRDIIRKYGLESNLASVRTINIPVLELERDIKKTSKVAGEAAEKAVVEDGAGAIVLGCTGMAGLAEGIYSYLKKKGYDVPVLDPLKVAINTAILMVLLGVRQSKEIFRKPREKTKKLPGLKL
jgi:allantoin racemase